jgi:hypothetical protein
MNLLLSHSLFDVFIFFIFMNYRDGFWLILDENVADLWLILDDFGVILVEIVAIGLLSVMVENYSVDCADLRLMK